jgi:hypothetical protein
MFSVRESFWNSPFVVTNTTPISNIIIPKYSFLAPRSLRNTNAIKAVNNDSALRSKDVLIAVVWFRPFKSSTGAIIEPERMMKARILKSFVVILASASGLSNNERIFLENGEVNSK